jgi:hypothetical protein
MTMEIRRSVRSPRILMAGLLLVAVAGCAAQGSTPSPFDTATPTTPSATPTPTFDSPTAALPSPSLGPSPATGIPSYVESGTMLQGHFHGIAVQLKNGSVLVAGGFAWGPTASAEVYDPVSGKFTVTGSMTVPRTYAAAALLADGRVLVTGGEGGGGPEMASAEIYDPTTGKFAATGSMSIPREGNTDTLLADGRVLIAGGWADGYVTETAEIYDPASGNFTATGSLKQRCEYQTATLLANGQVLVAGGDGGFSRSSATVVTVYSTAELYNPITGKFAYTVGPMTRPREFQTATLLTDGRVLLAGGDTATKKGSAEIFNPSTGKFVATGSMANPRFRHAAVRLGDGRVLVASGDLRDCWTKAPDECDWGITATSEIYDPASGKFTPAPSLDKSRDMLWAFPLTGGGAVIIGGGGADATPILESEIYQP